MKKLLTIFVSIILLANSVTGQTPKNHFLKNLDGTSSQEKSFMYNLSISNGTYTNLTNPISFTNGEVWDDPEGPITIPFSFQILNRSISTFYFLGLGGYISSVLESDSIYFLVANGADFVDRGYENEISLSSINYKTEGVDGSRIFKIEWLNVGSYDEGDPYSMYLNMQLWLYEGSNIIEWHYGPSSITDSVVFYDGGTGPTMGIGIEYNGAPLSAHIIGGTAMNPSLTTNITSMEGNPTNGTIYRLNPGSTAVYDNPKLAFSIYPNPVLETLHIKTDKTNSWITIFDYTGKMLLSQNILETGSVDVSTLPAGIYLLQIENEGVTQTQRFVKQ